MDSCHRSRELSGRLVTLIHLSIEHTPVIRMEPWVGFALLCLEFMVCLRPLAKVIFGISHIDIAAGQ